ncbi:hypothetical protein ACQY0O_000706 [Thecaphora frezii]
MLLTHLRLPRLLSSSPLSRLLPLSRSLSTSAPLLSAPRTKHLSQPGWNQKPKTHTSTKKRWTPTGAGSGKAFQLTFKRAYAGKSHLNSHMARDRLNRLGRTAYSPSGKVARTIRRLLAPSL